jgi:hypothetical protein
MTLNNISGPEKKSLLKALMPKHSKPLSESTRTPEKQNGG